MDLYSHDLGEQSRQPPIYSAAAVLRKLNALPPSSQLVFRHLVTSPHTRLNRRLAANGHVLAVVDIPDSGWEDLITKPLELALSDLAGSKRRVAKVDQPRNRTDRTNGPSPALELVFEHLKDQDTLLCGCVGPGMSIAHAFADLIVAIPPLSPESMSDLLRIRFQEHTRDWPCDIDPRDFDPRTVDSALQRATTAEDAISILRVCAQLSAAPVSTAPAFATLRGFGEAHDWGLRLIADICAYKAGSIRWTDVSSGALLIGPPGTGKTAFAQSLADALRLPFFPASYATWQGKGSGHLGDVTRAIQRTFSDASSQAPSIIFIDEIDVFQPRSTGRARDWWSSVTATLLEGMDGIGRRDGVIVLAACNGVIELDPALVRAGRLESKFRIALPDASALAGILSDKLEGAIDAAMLEPLLEGLAGTISGADAVRIARDVRRIARLAGRSATVADVACVALPEDARSPAFVRRVAVHEAGHAISYLAAGRLPASISILDQGLVGGTIRAAPAATDETRLTDIEGEIVHLLAGRAAEEVILGSPSAGAGGTDTSDIASATKLAFAIECKFGLGSRITFSDRADLEAVEVRLRRLYSEAMGVAIRHRASVVSLAEALLKERAFGQERIRDFAMEHGFVKQAREVPHDL